MIKNKDCNGKVLMSNYLLFMIVGVKTFKINLIKHKKMIIIQAHLFWAVLSLKKIYQNQSVKFQALKNRLSKKRQSDHF